MGRAGGKSRTPSEDDEEAEDDEDEEEMSRRESAVLLARDIAFAVILVLVLLGGIFAYSQVWPPMVVVESDSMSHGHTTSYVGVIDTGDLVLVQRVSDKADVLTWVEGKATGYRTYGDFGDVIIFHPNTAYYPIDSTPIIHRPILYVVWNENEAAFDVPALENPALAGLWEATNAAGASLPLPRGISGNLTIRELGYRGDLTIVFDLGRFARATANRVDGFVTMGDNNAYSSKYDVWNPGGVAVTPMSRVVGKARGELPWFGLLKLLVSPGTECCRYWGETQYNGARANAWGSLEVTLVLIPIGLYLADATYGFADEQWKWWRRNRKREARGGSEPDEAGEAPEPPGPGKET